MDYKIIDADGHVIEDDSLFDYLDLSYRAQDHQLSWDRLFPSLDFHHIGGHSTRNKKSFGGGKRVGLRENVRRFYGIWNRRDARKERKVRKDTIYHEVWISLSSSTEYEIAALLPS